MHLWVPFARHPKMHLILFFCLRLISFLPFRRSPITFALVLQSLRLCNLCLHLHNQHLQLLLALLAGIGVDIAGVLFAIGPLGGVASLEEVVIDLADTAGTGPALAAHIGLEVGHSRLFRLDRGGFLPWLRSVLLRRYLADAAVNVGSGCRCPAW